APGVAITPLRETAQALSLRACRIIAVVYHSTRCAPSQGNYPGGTTRVSRKKISGTRRTFARETSRLRRNFKSSEKALTTGVPSLLTPCARAGRRSGTSYPESAGAALVRSESVGVEGHDTPGSWRQ